MASRQGSLLNIHSAIRFGGHVYNGYAFKPGDNMPEKTYINLRKRMLCTLDASEILESAEGPQATLKQPISDDLVIAALNAAPYESSAQRRLQSHHLNLTREELNVDGKGEDIGVIVEFGVESGTDALAAYSDGVAGWFNSSDGLFMEATLKDEAKVVCENLMNAGLRIREITGAPSRNTPPAPPPGFICVSLIRKDGVSFGLGPARDLASDGYGGPIVHWALNLRNVILSVRRAA